VHLFAVAIPAYNPVAPAAAAFLLLLVLPSHHHMDTAEGLPPVVADQNEYAWAIRAPAKRQSGRVERLLLVVQPR
jgi:hypothetical protein